jgi:biotin carboxyl carrier protein
MKYVVSLGDREIEVELRPAAGNGLEARIGDRRRQVDLVPAGGRSLFSLLLDGASYEVSLIGDGDTTLVALRGTEFRMRVESEQARHARLLAGQGGPRGNDTVRSVMPGRVVRVQVKEGDLVQTGTPLLILEAMKMENEIRSPLAGSVRQIFVRDGQTVVNGDPLVLVGD